MSKADNGTKETAQFEAAIAHALKSWRDGDWLTLASSPLTRLSLIEPALLDGVSVGDDTRAQALQWMLRWGINQLQPNGTQSWLSNSWRHYNLLHYYYSEGWRVADVAEAFAIADQTFYEWRTQAVGALSYLLRSEIEQATHAEKRLRFAMEQRYVAESADCQAIMRLLALTEPAQPLPTQWLYTILPKLDIGEAINSLDESRLIDYDATAHSVQLHSQMVDYVRLQTSPVEHTGWLISLAEQFHGDGAYITAADYFLRAGESVRTAHLIVAHWQTIADHNQAAFLQPILQSINSNGFHNEQTLWAKLQLVAGQLSETLDDLPAAVAAYGNALAAPDLQTKAEAYYRRAKAYQRVDLDECISHYSVCIPLLERTAQASTLSTKLLTLLTQMYIDRAWIFIQERKDFSRAEHDLQRAAELISAENSALWSSLYNAQAGLAFRQDKTQDGIELRMQAWVAARASQQLELMMKIACNLGTDYAWAGNYSKALPYLERSYALAIEADNLQMQGGTLKGIGNCHFWEKRYQQAVDAYLRAYAVFANPANPNYLASTCADLTEALAELEEWEVAKRYFEEGQQISAEMQHNRYQEEFQDLATKYPMLITTLTPRQQQVVDFVKTNGAIRRPEYIELIGVSKSQAHRDLEELCQQNILQRIGKGRATRYVLL